MPLFCSNCSVAQSCLTLSDPMDCSLPSFPVFLPSSRACSNSCPLSQWCHPTILSSVVPFSFCLQYFPASNIELISDMGLISFKICILKVYLSVYTQHCSRKGLRWLKRLYKIHEGISNRRTRNEAYAKCICNPTPLLWVNRPQIWL